MYFSVEKQNIDIKLQKRSEWLRATTSLETRCFRQNSIAKFLLLHDTSNYKNTTQTNQQQKSNTFYNFLCQIKLISLNG